MRNASTYRPSQFNFMFLGQIKFLLGPGGQARKKNECHLISKCFISIYCSMSNAKRQYCVQIDNTEHEVTIFWPALQHLKASYK